MNKVKKVKKDEYVKCPRCGQEVFIESIVCPFCKFGIMAWIENEIDENGNEVKK